MEAQAWVMAYLGAGDSARHNPPNLFFSTRL